MDINEIAEKLHLALGEDLLGRVLGGQASPAELNVARQYLKDNGIDSVSFKESPLTKLADILPFGENKAVGE
mgnify:CR=1 FL=1|tara:strand:+ start:801 stop:1016 length:216 start_codon:yes stop_codon:yes gene_type:complete